MRKILLSTLLVPAFAAMAEIPQSSFFLSGFDGVTEATEGNTLVYAPALDPDELADDEDEGIYRFKIASFTVGTCANGFTLVGAEGLTLGYIADNLLGSPNDFGDKTGLMYVGESKEAIKCSLTPGDYAVTLMSVNGEEEGTYSWMLQFASLNGGDETLSYYILGFNGQEGPSQVNRFVATTVGEGDDASTMYTFPRFLVETCEDGFTVGASDGAAFGAEGTTVDDENPFALMTEGAAAVRCALTPGYYTLNWAPMGFMNMISFLRCEDQTAADGSTYYLIGFDGITEAKPEMKFSRKVETTEYEEEGETITGETVVYTLENVTLTSCPDGFTIATEDGGFTFGLNSDMAAFLSEVSETLPMAALGINGTPYGWTMPAGAYDLVFAPNNTGTAFMTVTPHDGNAAVEGLGTDGDEAPVYYNLQGVRVDKPGKGIYIRKSGNKAEKVSF